MASPVYFVKKKDDSLQLMQDYCKLNDITAKNGYSLPLLPDMINKISGSMVKYFTMLELHWGYNNVHIKDRDEWKASF